MRNNDQCQTNTHGYIITMKRLFNNETFTVCHIASNLNEAMAIANRHSFDSAKIIEVIDESTGEIVFPESPKHNKAYTQNPRLPNKNYSVYPSSNSSVPKPQQNTEDQKPSANIFSEWFDLILKSK